MLRAGLVQAADSVSVNLAGRCAMIAGGALQSCFFGNEHVAREISQGEESADGHTV